MRASIILVIVFAFCFRGATAQEQLIYSNTNFPESLDKQTELLKQLIPVIQDPLFTIQERFFNKSRHSKHYTFDVLYNQYPIYTSYIKVNTDNKNNILSIANGLGNTAILDAVTIAWMRSQWERTKLTTSHWPQGEEIKNQYYAIYALENIVHLVQVQEAWSKTYDKTKLINLADEVIGEWDHTRKLGIDTFVNINIFNPDPLTFLLQNYGAPYIDNNDQDQSWMSTAYIPVNVDAVYDTQVNLFFLENDYIKMSDIQSPTNVVPSSLNNNFYFNRSEDGFEDGMVAYHITNMHNHLTTLGYDTLMDLQLEADAHGQFGADNSVFNRNGGAPTIIFGDGGVDDAEDADVIIHEYSHGISWSANKNTFFGTERPALDEGIADYFATSYSRNLSNFRWEDVFTWDGHNQFFGGRTATTMTNYSNPFSGNLYALGEVWNAAMQKIYTDLGRNTTDALMLETLHFLTDNTTLPLAARYMLQADTLLNGGMNTATICQHFASKNILASDCYPISVPETISPSQFVQVFNSSAFSQGTAPVVFELDGMQKVNFQLFDMSGKLLSNKSISHQLSLSPDAYTHGIYIARFTTQNGSQTVKLSRY